MQLSGTGTRDPRWLEKICKHPPANLSQLEYWFGSIDVDFAGHEGRGYVNRPSDPPRGTLRPEVKRLGAEFRYDMDHEDAHHRRDMSLHSFWCELDVDHARLAQVLERTHGAGKPIATEDGGAVEYGAWFYLRLRDDGSAQLAWEHERPEWALVTVTGS